MRFLVSFLVLMSVALVGASGAHAADTLDLQSMMTAEDYAAFGLDKLTDAERARLGEWVQHYRDGALKGPPAPRTPEERAEDKAAQDEKDNKEVIGIIANVVPEFTGWTGQTYFRLDNGQVWQQRMSGNNMRYSGDDYRVTITKNWIGKFSLKHVETGRSTPVKRIK